MGTVDAGGKQTGGVQDEGHLRRHMNECGQQGIEQAADICSNIPSRDILLQLVVGYAFSRENSRVAVSAADFVVGGGGGGPPPYQQCRIADLLRLRGRTSRGGDRPHQRA